MVIYPPKTGFLNFCLKNPIKLWFIFLMHKLSQCSFYRYLVKLICILHYNLQACFSDKQLYLPKIWHCWKFLAYRTHCWVNQTLFCMLVGCNPLNALKYSFLIIPQCHFFQCVIDSKFASTYPARSCFPVHTMFSRPPVPYSPSRSWSFLE